MTLTYDTMNNWITLLVPALQAEYDEYVEMYEGHPVGPHVAYGSILMPYVVTHLNAGTDSGDLLRIFSLFGEMANHPDEMVVNVLWVTVVEHLLGWLTGDAFKRGINLMEAGTREAAYEMAELFRHCDEIRRLLSE